MKITGSQTIWAIWKDPELIFSGLDAFRQITSGDCEGYSATFGGDYSTLYTGNNEELEYNNDGSLIFDEDNPILFLEVEENNELFKDEYSLYFTVKADVMQGESYGGTIASIGEGNGVYIACVSIFQGYLQTFSYIEGNLGTDFLEETAQKGAGSIDITEYSNSIFNIQITSKKTGDTKVYINGEEKVIFESGGEDIATTCVTIGDLRPLRNLKFNGTLYDFAMYNKVLTDAEIQTNWEFAKNKWIDNL